MKKEFQTTVWLDILTYIILPLVTILGTIGVIKNLLYSSFNLEFFIYFLLEVVLLIFYGYTFYNSYKRTKQGYNLLRILMVISAIMAALDFANTESFNKGYNFILVFVIYLIAAAIIWIYPNLIYLKNRKELFKNKSTLKFTEKCSKCKRMYLKGKSCPKCEK